MSKRNVNYNSWPQRWWNVILLTVSGVAGGVVGVAMALSMFFISSKNFFLDETDKHGISEKNSSRLGGLVIFLGAIAFCFAQFVAGESSVFSSQSYMSENVPGYLGVAILCGAVGLWED